MNFVLKKRYFLNLILLTTLLSPELLFAQKPFRLLTVQTAYNPEAKVVLGLQELGINTGNVFIDTNPLVDLGYTANLGAKLIFPINSDVKMTLGARYFKFIGSQAVSDRVKATSTLIDKFNIDYQGLTSFIGASIDIGSLGYHANFQYADISGSKVSSPVLGVDWNFAEYWSLIGEAGYDVFNKQPRASFGISKYGPGFGLRLGATYVEIVDPIKTYKGIAPIVDFYWLIGTP